MNNSSIAQRKAKNKSAKKNNTILVSHPELRELVIDLAEFTAKHKPSALAKTFGLKKQNLQYYMKKRKETRKNEH